MATIGSLPPFDAKVRAWEEYCEIMEHFFTANDIMTEIKRSPSCLVWWEHKLINR